MGCGVGRIRGSDPTLLWCRPAAIALIQPSAWEPPHAVSAALKSKTKQNKKTLSNNDHLDTQLVVSKYHFLVTGAGIPSIND